MFKKSKAIISSSLLALATLFGVIWYMQNNYISTEVEKPSQAQAIIYGTAGCHYCKKARKLFSEQQIPYFEYDIEKNTRARKRFHQLGGRGTPLIILDKEVILGFNKTKIQAILNDEQQS